MRTNTRYKEIIMKSRGELIQSKIVVDVLLDELEKIPPNKIILIDGFPRSMENWKIWNLKHLPSSIIYLDCPDDVCIKRSMKRQRFDDNNEIMTQRLESFNRSTIPILEYLRKGGIPVTILNSTHSTDILITEYLN